MENLGRLVIVREDDRVLFFLQLVDRRNVGRVNRPFDIGNDLFDALSGMTFLTRS
jgi:hypothetical protein